jgi:hypothetical protein
MHMPFVNVINFLVVTSAVNSHDHSVVAIDADWRGLDHDAPAPAF